MSPVADLTTWEPDRPQTSFVSRREVAGSRLVLLPPDVAAVLHDNEIAEFVNNDEVPCHQLAESLLRAAKARGVKSPIKIVVLEIDDLFKKTKHK